MEFQELGLPEPILKALVDEGYTTPTPIQAQAIPVVLQGRDLLGIAQTGTGKTAAFALPILTRLAADRKPAPRRGCRALILSPTRELASQIGQSFKTYGRHMGLKVAVVFGGVSMRAQIDQLSRGVDILVATPGRLIDHMDSRNAVISGTEIFVLDEADQMLDLGFFRPIRKIVGQMSGRRQNLFFSATMPAEISKLADELLQDPVKVAVAPVATTAERVSQRVIHVEHAKKRAILVELLADESMARTLVFTRTKRGADRVAKHLDDAKIKAAAIHGNKSQRQREDALDAFKAGKIRVLVATDIAARGIDIDAVSHVINFELPEVPEAYVHRIGRTARAGAEGSAISLCDAEERNLLRAIERLTRQTIDSEDRRNDTSLPLDAPGTSDRRRSSMGNRGQNRGRSNSSSQSFEGRSEKPGGFRNRDRGERGERPAFRDSRPRAEGAGGGDRPSRPRPEGNWRDRTREDGGESRHASGDRPSRPRPEGGFRDRPRDGGGERRAEGSGGDRPSRPRPEGGFRERPRDGGGERRAEGSGGDRPSRPRPEGGFRDRPRDGGGERRGEGSGGDRSSRPRPEGGFRGRPRDGGGERRAEGSGGDRPSRPRSEGGFRDRPRDASGPGRSHGPRGDGDRGNERPRHSEGRGDRSERRGPSSHRGEGRGRDGDKPSGDKRRERPVASA